MNKYMTTKEVAEYTRTSPQTVREWINAGLTYIDFSETKIILDKDDVDEWMRKMKKVKKQGATK